ncbi:MAG: hypothetical protein A2X49_14925 [Lentisphaerae bacterium GWF2_52_8]|nr:MAG: hypothetical protein A2X49_14925 [Lentisphaerae bacterium GWF2_52_8]
MGKKLKLGIIGLGAIGKVHSDAYVANSKDAEIFAICDAMPERVKEQGEKLGVKNTFTDYKKLLASDVDAVSICTGNTTHMEIAVAAFKAGKHVLVEKPMAMNAVQAAKIVEAATKSRKTLQIGMVWRQSAEARLVRKYVEDGVLGNIYHMRAVMIRRRGIPGLGGWFTTKAQSGGGPLIDIGVHWFDIAMHLSGHWNPSSVSATCSGRFGSKMRDYKYVGMWAGPPNFNGVFDVEDHAMGMVRFGSKATMAFEISWAANAEEEMYVDLLGDKGGVRLFNGKPLKLLTEFNGNIADVNPQYADNENRFHLQAQKFIAACRGECPPAATGKEGLTNMKLIDAVYASSKAGREVKI